MGADVTKRNFFSKDNAETAARQAYQGLTMGWGDEGYDRLAAAYAAALTDGSYEDYLKQARDMTNKSISEDWKQSPVTSLAANVVGGIPLALSAPAKALSGWARSSNLLGAMGKGAAVGAGYGAIAGGGGANPDQNAGLVDALLARGRGAAIGGTGGAVLGAIGGALSRSNPPPDGPNFSKVGKAVGKLQPTKAQKMLAEQLAARPDLQEQLARAEAMNTASENTGIKLTLAEKIAQSQSDPLLAQQKLLGGNPQTAGAMEALYADRSGTPNQTGSIENALLGQAKRLAPDVGSYDEAATALIGKSKEAVESVTKQLTDEASPLYKEAFQANKSMQSPVIDKILRTPEGKTALKHAATLMQNQMVRLAVPDKELTEAARDLVSVGKMSEVPNGGIASGLKMQTLDNIKKGFDSAISDALSRSSPGTTSAEARALMDLRSGLISEMDKLDITGIAGPNSLVPEGGAYARARAVYSGQPEVLQMRERIGNVANIDPLQAKQVGQQLFSGTQKNAKMAAKALGPQGSKMAAAARIYDVMDTARGDPTSFASKIAPDARTADMLRTYAGSNQLDETLNVINQAKIGEKFRYGSPTQPLQESSQAMKEAAGGALDLVTGNKVGLLRKAAEKLGIGEDPRFYQDMMDLMTTEKGLDVVRQVAKQQGTAIQKQEASRALVSALQNKTSFLAQPLRNATIMGLTPQAQIKEAPINDPLQTPMLPQGFLRDRQGSLPQGFIKDRR